MTDSDTTMTVWKFPVEMSEHWTLDLPEGSSALTVQLQNGQPMIWVLVRDLAKFLPTETRHFCTHGTGHPINHGTRTYLNYINTFQLLDGSLIFHVFEILNPTPTTHKPPRDSRLTIRR